ncbi:hypothetical protein [Polaromonas sp. CG_9.11]|uniref:hypothetical protein n=1 Tax=Polaromonas sp. CG_9.11 TaxID=2787730 RepID=UPI0018CA3277|nr:hypothetical protein [Polaromonas sp. CG_9.11]MBG6077989.1 hypothetical protein [Polaromonas sp. CG_9.11]
MITKKQRAVVGACEHCGSGENLESAHVHGRDRIQIIDFLLGSIEKDNEVEVDLKQFEEAFKSEHEPFEKAILVLCTACHRKYDSPAVRLKALAKDETGMDEEGNPSGQGLVNSDILPITLDPIDPSVFKEKLMKRKAAKITIFYEDGRTVTRSWIAKRFAATSNIFGNLRSRPEFRQGKWQAHGIIKIHVNFDQMTGNKIIKPPIHVSGLYKSIRKVD